tara:strand:- start:1688 stop:3277 length:1590 start_codon:yes stop_codon:yes gene_type:complete
MSVCNPLESITEEEFFNLFDDLEMFLSDRSADLWTDNSLFWRLCCELSFSNVAPTLQRELLFDRRVAFCRDTVGGSECRGAKMVNSGYIRCERCFSSEPLDMSSLVPFPYKFQHEEVLMLGLFFQSRLRDIVENQASLHEFFNWLSSSPELFTLPITSVDSIDHIPLNSAGIEHAVEFEVSFMDDLQEENFWEDYYSERHLALLKSIGLWLWHSSYRAEGEHRSVIDRRKRWGSISALISLSYQPNVPIVWGMATEYLTSTTQMTILGLRLQEILEGETSCLPQKDLWYLVGSDHDVDGYARGSLLLDYSKVKHGIHDWIFENTRGGIDTLVNSAKLVCVEIGLQLSRCGCCINDRVMTSLVAVAEKSESETVAVKREMIDELSFGAEVMEILSGHDMYPPMFEGHQNRLPIEVLNLCNYVGRWWSEECPHSPDSNDLRIHGSRLSKTGKIFEILDQRWINDPDKVHITERSRSKTISNILNKIALPELKKDETADQLDLNDVDRDWPAKKSWDHGFILDDFHCEDDFS